MAARENSAAGVNTLSVRSRKSSSHRANTLVDKTSSSRRIETMFKLAEQLQNTNSLMDLRLSKPRASRHFALESNSTDKVIALRVLDV